MNTDKAKIRKGIWIPNSVSLGENVSIGFGTIIEKLSRIGNNVRIGHGCVIDRKVRIEDNVFIGHNTVIRENTRILRNCVIGHLVVVERDTIIKPETTIQSQCHITAEASIGSRCYFGPGVVIINERKISKFRNDVLEQKLQGPRIGNGCRIGARSLIMPGVTIGNNAMIAAGGIITKDVQPQEVFMGSAAKKVGVVSKEELI